jgi:hypothetical protein
MRIQRLIHRPLLIGLIAILFLLSFNVFTSAAQSNDEPVGLACALTGGKTDGFGLDVSEFGLDVSEFGLDVSEFGLDVSEFGLDVSEFGLDVSEFGLDVSEFGLDVSEFESAVVDMIDPANNIQGDWLPASIDTEITIGDGFGSTAVAILVIDDFGGSLDPMDPSTHGYKVFTVLEFLSTVLLDRGVTDREGNPLNIEIVPVDMSTKDFEVGEDATAGGITQLISDAVVEARGNGFDHIVINMSWGLVPCDDVFEDIIVTPIFGDEITFDLNWDFEQYLDIINEYDIPVPDEEYSLFLDDVCVEPEIDPETEETRYFAHFSYYSDYPEDVIIPYGDSDGLVNQFNLYTFNDEFEEYELVEGDANGVQPEIFNPGGYNPSAFAIEFDPFAESNLQMEWYIQYGFESSSIITFDTLFDFYPGESSTCSDIEQSVPNYLEEPRPLETVGSGLIGYFVEQLKQALQEDGVDSFLWSLYYEDFITQLITTILPSLVSEYNGGNLEGTPVEGLEALLQGYLAESDTSDQKTIPVGAAGNHAHLFGPNPFYPASSPSVVGVSGGLGDFGDKSYFSNSGNVIAPGFSFVLAEDGNGNATLLFPGSSGAAPHSAMHAALWLSYPDACDFSNGIPLENFARGETDNAVFNTDQDPYLCSSEVAAAPEITASQTTLVLDEGTSSGFIGTFANGTLSYTPMAAPIQLNMSGNQWGITVGDGPNGPFQVTIMVMGANNQTTSVQLTVTVDNVAPTATFVASSTSVQAGGSISFALNSAVDILPDDIAGFDYTFNCGAPVLPVVSNNTATCTYPTAGNFVASGTITDKDGGFSTYTMDIQVTDAPPQDGTLTITKVVSGDPAPPQTMFTVNVLDSSSAIVATVPFPVGGGTSNPITLAPGLYTVEEVNPGPGWTVAYSDNTQLVQVLAGGQVSKTVTNTYVAPAQVGTLTITKIVNGDPAPANSAFLINVKDSNGTVVAPVPFGAAGGTSSPITLPVGSYTLEEINPGEGWTVTGNNQVVNVALNVDTPATITNTYTAPVVIECTREDLLNDVQGYIIRPVGQPAQAFVENISDVCTHKAGLAAYKKFDEVIDDQELFQFTEIVLAPGQSATIQVELPECAAQLDLFRGDVLPSLQGVRYSERLIDVAYPPGNGYCVPENAVGTVEVTKSVVGEGVPQDASFQITISGANGNAVLNFGAAGGTQQAQLLPGDYTVTEAPLGEGWSVGYSAQQITVTPAGFVQVTVTNTFTAADSDEDGVPD